jgi:hypothetical protein
MIRTPRLAFADGRTPVKRSNPPLFNLWTVRNSKVLVFAVARETG